MYDKVIENDQSYNVRKRSQFSEYIQKMNKPFIVELGVLDGACLFWLGREAHKVGGTVVGVDCFDETPCYPGKHHWQKLEDTLREMIKEENLIQVVTLVKSWTDDYVDKVADNSIDLLHIDAGHTLESAMTDIKNYWPKVKSGGCIFFDDEGWNDNGVMTVGAAIQWATEKGMQLLYRNDYAIGIKP